MELPICNVLPSSNKQMCGERRREGVVIHQWYSDRTIWQ